MPRLKNSQFSSFALVKKKIFQGTSKFGRYKRRASNAYKKDTGKTRSSYKLEKVFRLSDLFSYPLASSKNVLSFGPFDFTQKRNYSCDRSPEQWEEGCPRVAIVGAGIAGLSAANHLISNGFSNFQIYEATNRLGGRVNTVKFSKSGSCELGAEWLAGGDMSNSLILLACQEGLMGNAERRYNRQLVCLTPEGRALCSDLCALGRRIFNRIRSDAHKLYVIASDFKHGTLSYFIDKRIGEEVQSVGEACKENLLRLMYALKNDLRTRWGAELAKMSSDHLGAYAEEPRDGIRLPDGLVHTLLPLIRNIPHEKIHLASPVKTVFWEPTKKSIILDEGREVSVDYIIVTVPLGYLKENIDSFFSPKLPDKKYDAINRIGFGAQTKIFMKYKSEIWGKRRTDISTCWKSRDWSDRESYWYKGISSVEVKGDVAAVTVAGAEAVYAEEETGSLIEQDLTSLLRCFTGATFLPRPVEIVKSRWNTDPWYNGAGSYMTLDSKLADLPALAEPLMCLKKPVVLFAGEATFPSKLSTVHGARSTGIREAQHVMNLMTQTDSCPEPKPDPCPASPKKVCPQKEDDSCKVQKKPCPEYEESGHSCPNREECPCPKEKK